LATQFEQQFQPAGAVKLTDTMRGNGNPGRMRAALPDLLDAGRR